jgi:hypothetical protein
MAARVVKNGVRFPVSFSFYFLLWGFEKVDRSYLGVQHQAEINT